MMKKKNYWQTMIQNNPKMAKRPNLDNEITDKEHGSKATHVLCLVQFHVHVLELRFEVSTEFRTLRFESGRQQTILY